MTVAAVGMVRDEADVIAGTIAHLRNEGIEHIVVADNGSVDGTRDILHELDVEVIDDPVVAYHQSDKMTALAARAAAAGARWIVPFDADEIWVSHHGLIDRVLRNAPADVNLATGQLFNHFPTAIDPAEADPFRSIIWRQPAPGALPKVAFRWEPGAVIHQGNHGVDLPSGSRPFDAALEIRHFPYRSAEQFVRKARNGAEAYAATDYPDHVGAHWRGYGTILERYGEAALEDVFREHFWFLSPADAGLTPDPAPYLR